MLDYKKNVVFESLKFFVSKSHPIELQIKQFFAMCRYQLNNNPETICSEMKHFFKNEAPTEAVIKEWISAMWLSVVFKLNDDGLSSGKSEPKEQEYFESAAKNKLQETYKKEKNNDKTVNSTEKIFKIPNSASLRSVQNSNKKSLFFSKIEITRKKLNKSPRPESLLVAKFKESLSRKFKSADNIADNLAKMTRNTVTMPLEPLLRPKKILEKLSGTKLSNEKYDSNIQILKLMQENEILKKEKNHLESELKNFKEKHTALEKTYAEMYTELKLAAALSDHSKISLETQYTNQISIYQSEINELKKRQSVFEILDKDNLFDINPDAYCLYENEEESEADNLRRKISILQEDYKIDIADLKKRIQDYIKERDEYKAQLEIQLLTVQRLTVERQNLFKSVNERQKKEIEAQKYFEEIKIAVLHHNREKNILNEMKKKIENLQADLNEEFDNNSHLKADSKKLYRKYTDERNEREQLEDELLKSKANFKNQMKQLRDKYRSLADKYDLKNTEIDELKAKYQSMKKQIKKQIESSLINDYTRIRSETSMISMDQSTSDEFHLYSTPISSLSSSNGNISFKRMLDESEKDLENHSRKHLKKHA